MIVPKDAREKVLLEMKLALEAAGYEVNRKGTVAEQFREVVESMDEWSWHDIMRASRDTDYIGQGRIAAQKRDDLAMLVRRIIYRHSKELPLEEVLAAADDYLARNQLNGSPLRDEAASQEQKP